MKTNVITIWILVALGAVLLSVPFLVGHCGWMALVGLVPLLCIDRITRLAKMRRAWCYFAATFALWNTMTTFWVCNATVGGGIFAIAANTLQMTVIFSIFRYSQKHLRGLLPYIFLAAMWIAWERAYFLADISWPWLTLGNAFARSVGMVQWYEFTGVEGGSLWVWLTNITLFHLMVSLSEGTFGLNAAGQPSWKAPTAFIVWAVAIFIGPIALSRIMFNAYEEAERPFDVVVLQPNIDPYHKFESLKQWEQNEILLEQMRCAMSSSPDSLQGPLLLLAPETFTNDVVVDLYENSRTIASFNDFLKDYDGANLIFGASSHTFYPKGRRPSELARQLRDGRWYDSHNSALVIDGTGRLEIYHKTMLVVGVEKMPYPKIFRAIDEKLGGVIGRCVGQEEPSVLNVMSGEQVVPIGCAVCYESAYGEYCTGYIAKGAQALTIITNDAWWGNTPGYRQHLSFASLRAIETRRSIARCGNTGISGFVDQRGIIHGATPWWEKAIIKGTINLNDKVTFFAEHGDVIGRVCTFVFWLYILMLIVVVI